MRYFCVSCQRTHQNATTPAAQFFVGVAHDTEGGKGNPIGFCKVKQKDLIKRESGSKELFDAV